MNQKLFVLSMDAMVGEDLLYLQSKPYYGELLKRCSRVENVTTIYPSITYPAYVSIIIGCYPGKHGVFTNGTFKTIDGPTFWHYKQEVVRVEDIFTAARSAGYSTAAVYWPVTGCHPDIDYLIDEFFFPDPGQTIEDGFASLGSNEAALEVVRKNLYRFPTYIGSIEPDNCLDDFANGCTCTMIRDFRPDVLFVHNSYIDTIRHQNGVFNEQVNKALDLADQWLGEIIEAMKEAGVYEQTNFVILSDHGQLEYTRRIKLNQLLHEGGFVRVASDGSIQDWLAFSQSNGFSATILLKRDDKTLYESVYTYLSALKEEGKWGIGEVYTREQVNSQYGLSGDFAFVVESDGISAFYDGVGEPTVIHYDSPRATHGYEPQKGPQPFLLASGPGFAKQVRLDRCTIIDEAPTFARLLGIPFLQAQGTCLDGLF